MKIIKISQLFIVSLVLGVIFGQSVVFAEAEIKNQVDVNVDRVNVNGNQTEVQDEQNNVNENQNVTNENEVNINENEDQNNMDDDQEDTNENDDINKIEESQTDDNDDNNMLNGEEHRSAVSTFVKNLLDVADREQGGIGEQVRVIAQQQNESKENVASAIDKIKNRSGFKTFFIGTDYKNVGQLRSEMVKTENHINQLKGILDQTVNIENKTSIQMQVQVLEQEQQKISDFLRENENKISLLGWLVKLFNK